MAIQQSRPRPVQRSITYVLWFALIALPFGAVLHACNFVGSFAMRVVWWTAPPEGRAVLREGGYDA